MRVACVLGGLPEPIPQYEVVEGGTWLARVDLAWPEAKVVVEYEGAHHVDGLQVVRDDARLGRLVAAGRTVLRLSAADLRSMDDVVRRIAQALGVVPRRHVTGAPAVSAEIAGAHPGSSAVFHVEPARALSTALRVSLWSPSPHGGAMSRSLVPVTAVDWSTSCPQRCAQAGEISPRSLTRGHDLPGGRPRGLVLGTSTLVLLTCAFTATGLVGRRWPGRRARAPG